MDSDDATGNLPYLQIAQQNVFHIQELLAKLERAENQRDKALQSLQLAKDECVSLQRSAEKWEQSSKQWEQQCKKSEKKYQAMRANIQSAIQSQTPPAAPTIPNLSAHTKRFAANALRLQQRLPPLDVSIGKPPTKAQSSDIFGEY